MTPRPRPRPAGSASRRAPDDRSRIRDLWTKAIDGPRITWGGEEGTLREHLRREANRIGRDLADVSAHPALALLSLSWRAARSAALLDREIDQLEQRGVLISGDEGADAEELVHEFTFPLVLLLTLDMALRQAEQAYALAEAEGALVDLLRLDGCIVAVADMERPMPEVAIDFAGARRMELLHAMQSIEYRREVTDADVGPDGRWAAVPLEPDTIAELGIALLIGELTRARRLEPRELDRLETAKRRCAVLIAPEQARPDAARSTPRREPVESRLATAQVHQYLQKTDIDQACSENADLAKDIYEAMLRRARRAEQAGGCDWAVKQDGRWRFHPETVLMEIKARPSIRRLRRGRLVDEIEDLGLEWPQDMYIQQTPADAPTDAGGAQRTTPRKRSAA